MPFFHRLAAVVPSMSLSICPLLHRSSFGFRTVSKFYSRDPYSAAIRSSKFLHTRVSKRTFQPFFGRNFVCFSSASIENDCKEMQKWSCLSSWAAGNSKDFDNIADGNVENHLISSLLVCGDGDLSYSASVASDLARLGICMVATVLEEKFQHQSVYQHSEKNQEIIENHGHKVLFGVDATNLAHSFSSEQNFDRIQFNFPHWRGKTNTRYNRQLLNSFFQSASQKLSTPNGEVHVALCQGQGGTYASSLEEWKSSWLAAAYAARHGLLLARIDPFKASYNRSSHRGADRPFAVGEHPDLYKFVLASVDQGGQENSVGAPKALQVSCRHELHVELPTDPETGELVGIETNSFLQQVVDGSMMQDTVQRILPKGIAVEVPMRDIVPIVDAKGCHYTVAVFLIVYSGEKTTITREEADQYRSKTEKELGELLPLRESRRGRMVSRPFPYRLLTRLIEDQRTQH